MAARVPLTPCRTKLLSTRAPTPVLCPFKPELVRLSLYDCLALARPIADRAGSKPFPGASPWPCLILSTSPSTCNVSTSWLTSLAFA
jgi:hypothetical protein